MRLEAWSFYKRGIASDRKKICDEFALLIGHDAFLYSRLLVDELDSDSRRHSARRVPDYSVNVCGRTLRKHDVLGCEQHSNRQRGEQDLSHGFSSRFGRKNPRPDL